MSALKEHLENSLKAMGIAAEERQIEQFERYHALLMDWNTRMDLTAVLEEAEMRCV